MMKLAEKISEKEKLVIALTEIKQKRETSEKDLIETKKIN